MNKKLPLFELTVDDSNDNNTGISCISLVEKPAIEVDFLKFAEEKVVQKFAIQDKDMQIVSGPIMIPGILIFRNDSRGQYYVTATKESIYQMVQKYARTQRPTNVNLEHGQDGAAPGCYLFESFVIDGSRGIVAPKEYADLPDGTWFGSMKIEDPEIWASVLDGTFNGFSIEGFFDLVPKVQMSAIPMNDMQILNLLSQLVESVEE